MQKCFNICWFQPLKRIVLLFFFVIYDSKWRVFGFGTVDWTKKQLEDITLVSGKL